MMSRRTPRDAPSREQLLSVYGQALALTADATPEEKARALKALGLDEVGLAELSAEADAAIALAIASDDIASLLAFKTAFDGGRAEVERARAAKVPSPLPRVVASPTAPEPSDALVFPMRRRPKAEVPAVCEDAVRGFTLMRYAALRADVINSAEHARSAVFSRYGLTEEEDLRLAAAWNERFGADRSVFQQYLQLFNYFRGLVRR